MTLLSVAAFLFFAAHAILLFTSFGSKGYKSRQYAWSHYTLWIAGILFSTLLFLYAGKQISPAIDAFNTPFKRLIPVFIAFGLSIPVHTIVKRWVLPSRQAVRGKDL